MKSSVVGVGKSCPHSLLLLLEASWLKLHSAAVPTVVCSVTGRTRHWWSGEEVKGRIFLHTGLGYFDRRPSQVVVLNSLNIPRIRNVRLLLSVYVLELIELILGT